MDYFEMFLRDMLCEHGDKFKYWNCLCDLFIVFVTIVMKGNGVAIIRIYQEVAITGHPRYLLI